MGALPSRESNEDPSSVFFANCGSHVVFHIPMTPHFFPSSDGLAFQQLFHARNSQSALYSFDMEDVSSVLPQQVSEAFREAQDEDWGAEVEEPDPSVHYHDAEINEKIKEYAGTVRETEPRVGRHFKHSIEDPDTLYKVLVEDPSAGTLVDTDAEMCELFEAEQRWRAAVSREFISAAQQQKNMKEGHGEAEDGCAGARPAAATLPPPPKKFLYPLPQAFALRMTTEEEEEMRAEYCRLHSIPYVAPHFYNVKPGSTPPMMGAESLTQDGVLRTSSSTCFVDCPMPLPLPLVERRRYHFEDDPKYRDGRVHLVEEHGVLYHFAYFPKKRRLNPPQKVSKSSSSTAAETETGRSLASAPIVLGRCLHDVVYSEEPDTSVPSNKQLAAATAAAVAPSSSSPFGAVPNSSVEPEAAPAKRYGRCARCGARIEQRMDYTQLRRLRATRLQRREMRRAEELARQQGSNSSSESDPSSNTAEENKDTAAQREAWAAFAAAHSSESDEVPGNDNDFEVVSHTERVEEEGEEEFIINIAPVRIAGMDGLLPSRARGTPWLRGYEHEDEAAADQYVEHLEHKPPVMRTCRFMDGSVGDKVVNRATLVTMLSYRTMCRQAGLPNALTRPVWSTYVLSNIPCLQMVRETFFRAKAAVAEIEDNDMQLRRWLDVVDRENNFYNFINANLYMMRNYTPPERTVRQHELPDGTSTAATAGATSSVACCCENGGTCTGCGNSAASSPPRGSPTEKAENLGCGVDHQQHQQCNAKGAPTSPSHTRDLRGECGENSASATASVLERQHSDENVGGDVPFSWSSSPSVPDASTSTPVDAASTHGEGGQHQHAAATSLSASRPGLSDAARRCAQRTGDTAAAATAVGGNDTRKGEGAESETGNQNKHAGSAEPRNCHRRWNSEEVAVGRSECHGPRGVIRGEFDDGSDGLESRSDVARGNDTRARAARRKEEQRKPNEFKTGAAAAISAPVTAVADLAGECDTSTVATTRVASWRSPAAVGVAPTPLPLSAPDVASNDDGGEASGKSTLPAPSNAVPHHGSTTEAMSRTPAREGVGDGGRHSEGEKNEQDAEGLDLRMVEEGQARGACTAQQGKSSATDSESKHKQLLSMCGESGISSKKQSPSSLMPQRIEVPPRPNFQLFSSRLEPHAPLALYTLFECDGSTDAGMVGSGAGDGASGAGLLAKGTVDPCVSAAAKDVCSNSGAFEHGATALPHYVQHDLLRENERRQAEPKSMRRPSHALYECGMLATTRGRNFLFLLREDCVHALLFYLSSAAAPIFIGAYIEPVDTTSVSYGGAVRLQRPGSLNIPLDEEEAEAKVAERKASSSDSEVREGSGRARNLALSRCVEDDGEQLLCSEATSGQGEAEVGAVVAGRSHSSASASARRVIIGPVEGIEVMTEYFKSKGLITCFSVSDVEGIAPGPSAAHRLHKMILPPTPQSSKGSCVSLQTEEYALASQQSREAAQYGHTFTYAAHEFCDGDLVVYNFDERRWEHYEHVQLRRRFAARAAAVAAAAASPVERSSAASSFNSITALDLRPSVFGRGDEGGGGGGRVSDHVHDDVEVVVDGSIGGASSLMDASMSVRLLCVGLDELLLSWTKWVVDNRFYEDRNDLGWLSLPDGSPIQLGGRYFLWSFRHNHQRYFYGVIPKFAKGRLRRQKLMERNRKKKGSNTASGAAASRVSASALAPTSKDVKQKDQRAAKTSTSRSPFTAQSSRRPHSASSSCNRGNRGRKLGNAGAHADAFQLSSGFSSLRSGSNGGCTQIYQHSQWLPKGSRAQAAPSNASVITTGYSSYQQQHSNAPLQAQPRDGLDCKEAPPVPSARVPRQYGAAHAYWQDSRQRQQQQSTSTSQSQVLDAPTRSPWPSTSPLYKTAPDAAAGSPPATVTAMAVAATSSNFASVRVGGNIVLPPSSPSLANSSSIAGARTPSARGAPQPGPPPWLPLGGRRTPRSPPLTPPFQTSSCGVNATGGGPSPYYQYGGNTFIQDGKRYENEYYPPLPPTTSFRPSPQASAAKLVPLPHPQAERGGIPAMFRYWGPVGHPSSRSSALSSSARRQVCQSDSVSTKALVETMVSNHYGSVNGSPRSPVAGSAVAAVAGGNPMPASTMRHLRVRVRQRSTSTAAVATALSGSSSLSTPVTTMTLASAPSSTAATISGSLANTGPASFPATPALYGEQQLHVLVGAVPAPIVATPRRGIPAIASSVAAVGVDGGPNEPPPHRLSPTSMLPANLINEGSKTKGESVLRVDEDMYVQRKAFRWNPYASTKWSAGQHETYKAGE